MKNRKNVVFFCTQMHYTNQITFNSIICNFNSDSNRVAIKNHSSKAHSAIEHYKYRLIVVIKRSLLWIVDCGLLRMLTSPIPQQQHSN